MYDAGQSVSWSHISWAETLPANTDIQFQVALSNSLSGPWTYLGPDGTAGTFFTTASGETLPATPAFQGRYARFQTRLSSTDGLFTPTFGNVHLSFTGAGLLSSSCNNFVYDPAGNITSVETVTDSGTTVDDRNPVANPINALNQILQRDVNGVTWLYSWDLSGNLLGKTNGIDTFLNTWNDLNQLTRVQGPGGLDVSYTYDTSGRMLTRTSGGITTLFTWSGWDCVKETTGSSVTLYHIPDGTLHSFSLDGAVFQCHADALGSVRMITDASGTVVARLEYGAWGEEIFVSAIPALANFPYRFVGSLGVRTDEETGLLYMRARHYDPGTQRFISRDTLMSVNRYAYAANSPQDFVDVTGLEPVGPIRDKYMRLRIYGQQLQRQTGWKQYGKAAPHIKPIVGAFKLTGLEAFCKLLERTAGEASNVGEFLDLMQLLFLPNHAIELTQSATTGIIPNELQDIRMKGFGYGWSVLLPETGLPNSLRDSVGPNPGQDNFHHMMFFLLAAQKNGSAVPMIGAWAIDRGNPGDQNMGYIGAQFGNVIPRDRRVKMTDLNGTGWVGSCWAHSLCERLRNE